MVLKYVWSTSNIYKDHDKSLRPKLFCGGHNKYICIYKYHISYFIYQISYIIYHISYIIYHIPYIIYHNVIYIYMYMYIYNMVS